MEDDDLFGPNDGLLIGDDIDIFNDPTINTFIDNNQFKASIEFEPQDIVAALVDIGVVSILEEDLFCRTSPLNKRSILDYPNFILQRDYKFKRGSMCAHFFYNQTTRMYFTESSSCINTYLAITQPTLMCKIADSVEKLKEIFGDDAFSFDCIRALALFQNATVQERRLGLMIQGWWKVFKDFRFAFKLPFYWRERNYYMTEEEQEAIEAEFGALSQEEQEAFQEAHMISDKFGFGDLRLDMDFPVISNYGKMRSRMGFFVTIPSSIPIIKGLLGSDYQPTSCRPKFNFSEMFNLAGDPSTRDELDKIVRDFFLCAIDGISSNLLDTSLGNNRHLGIGFLMRTKTPLSVLIKRPWAEKVYWKGKMTFEYLFPHRRKRWFIQYQNPCLFAERNFEDYTEDPEEISTERAMSDLEFLEKHFVDKFFPYVFDTKVRPGIVFMWASRLAYESRKIGFNLGWDTWVRTGERLSDIFVTNSLQSSLDVQKAKRCFAYQWGVYASLFFKIKRWTKEIVISLNANAIASSRGIGQDFLLSLNIESNF